MKAGMDQVRGRGACSLGPRTCFWRVSLRVADLGGVVSVFRQISACLQDLLGTCKIVGQVSDV